MLRLKLKRSTSPHRDVSLQESAEALNGVTSSAAHVFEGDFHMEFCDNLKQLLQAYFRDFSFERLDRPWRAFTASWSRNAVARHMGINSSYVTGQHCYVLVRIWVRGVLPKWVV
jgi:hypothetical protein